MNYIRRESADMTSKFQPQKRIVTGIAGTIFNKVDFGRYPFPVI
jgi:hypothetical protein